MKKFYSNYVKPFIKDTEGAELIQWAIIIAIMAALAVVAYAISQIAISKLSGAKEALEGINTPSTNSVPNSTNP